MLRGVCLWLVIVLRSTRPPKKSRFFFWRVWAGFLPLASYLISGTVLKSERQQPEFGLSGFAFNAKSKSVEFFCCLSLLDPRLEARGTASALARGRSITNRHDSLWFESFRSHFALFWSFWLAISEPGCTSRKKAPLEFRLKSTRPSHGRVCWTLHPPEARQNFLLAGLSAIPRFAQLHCEKLTQKKFRAAREIMAT